MKNPSYVLGIDFGSDSVRAAIINSDDGTELVSKVANYRRWAKQEFCNPGINQFRQHPLDYIEGLEEAILGALEQVSLEVKENIKGLGIDTTGSTPCAIDSEGIPLALKDEFANNPNAMFILWKDHTAVEEAAKINELAWNWEGEDFTKYVGGVYSSEWFWAKILYVLRKDEKVRKAAYSWVEHCDWIPALLTDTTHPDKIKRSRCAAGHKAMWHADWDGLPTDEFLTKLDPLLAGLRERLYHQSYTSDQKAGGLSEKWAKRFGLKSGIAVAVGAFDAHMGAVGAGIAEKALVKIMGTSTCDVMVAPKDVIGNKLVRGICGQVDGSVLPGMIGLEAGQSGFGDVFAWFKNLLSWPLHSLPSSEQLDPQIKESMENEILNTLTEQAVQEDLTETTLLALDWLNGRRTPYANQKLKGAILGLNLATSAPKIFRSLVEATAFGARAVVDRFKEEGVEIEEVIAIGGIPKKNSFIMQVTADVFQMPIKVPDSYQTCALGAAIFAAVAAEIYSDVDQAKEKMASSYSDTFYPDAKNAQHYNELYKKYLSTGKHLEDVLCSL